MTEYLSEGPIIAFHGGMCCGIKTIHALGLNPSQKVVAIEVAKCNRNHDACYEYTYGNFNFFTETAPVETALERVKRYIKFIEKRRPQHIVEITLCKSSSNFLSQDKWVPYLRRMGFKKSVENKNSNSGNIVVVYHKTIGEKK